ncbi:unnamed protein product [Auanema sp. JU1783]|nr:unnamed protein product [Auanema sp. JU1783]
MSNNQDPRWGDYYYQQKRPKGRAAWVLEMINHVNNNVPRFNDLFDEETFYVFAILVIVISILTAIFLSRVVGIEIKEHDITINRDWGEPTPAGIFSFPWKAKKE